MSSVLDLVNALKATAASEVHSTQDKKTFEELFSAALKNALDSINAGVDPFEFEDIVISNVIVFAEDAGYSKEETESFLKDLLHDEDFE